MSLIVVSKSGNWQDPVIQKYAIQHNLPVVWVPQRSCTYGVPSKCWDARIALIWNGHQDCTTALAEGFRSRQIPVCFFEQGIYTQKTTYTFDPSGMVGNSSLCSPLHWVTPADTQQLKDRRKQLRSDHPPKPSHVLLTLQIPMDTQMIHHSPWGRPVLPDNRHPVIEHVATLFPNDRIIVRPHPKSRRPPPKVPNNCTLSDPGTPFSEDLRRARLLVSTTSTTLWEAAIYGIPVLPLKGRHPLTFHEPSNHDRACAGLLALTQSRQTGCLHSVLTRFGINPL